MTVWVDRRTLAKAVKVAGKKIRLKSDRALNDILDYSCGSLAEAYRCGMEETQGDIIQRLEALGRGS